MLDDNINDVELLDEVSKVTQPGTALYEQIKEFNAHPKLRVPETIISWMGGTDPFKVNLKSVLERLPDE